MKTETGFQWFAAPPPPPPARVALQTMLVQTAALHDHGYAAPPSPLRVLVSHLRLTHIPFPWNKPGRTTRGRWG